MIKKVFLGLTITTILIIGVFGLVKTSYAQEISDTPEAAVEEIISPEPQTLEYEYMYQNGSVNGDVEAVQSQTRTRLFEMQDGECDADCDPQQLREQIGINSDGTMLQQRLNQGEFDCTGDCDPQQLRLNDGLNGNGAGREASGFANGICDGSGLMGTQGQGYKGNN